MLKRTLSCLPLIALLVLVQPRAEAVPVISAPFVTAAVGDAFLILISIIDSVDLASKSISHLPR